jgi:methyltransferase (TIGR00027 family)
VDQGQPSRTAVLVCQGRAVAHGRLAIGRFDDPSAMLLLRQDERAPVESVRRGEPPKGWGDRLAYEQLRATAEVMVPRTVAIDEAVRASPAPQVVLLGAGLDGRAWRMAELAEADAEVFEVDHPATQRDKVDRLGSMTPLARSVQFVAVDFGVDDLDAALGAAGHDTEATTTWIWEGVVSYLTPVAVESTMATIARRSAPGSRLVVNYQAPAWSATAGRLFATVMWRLAGREAPTASEPRRSSWTAETMRALLAEHGFEVQSDRDLGAVAATLGLEVRNRRSLAAGRVAVAVAVSVSRPPTSAA